MPTGVRGAHRRPCAEGHIFTTASFPLQQLGSGQIGPELLICCPRCARLRHAVPVLFEQR
ncbi:hypothetical protein [Streptomyces sp. P5_D11]